MTYVDARPLSPAELAVLQAVLAVAPTPHTPALQELPLEDLVVHSQCDCGCVSVGFIAKEDRPSSDTKLIADGLGLSAGSKGLVSSFTALHDKWWNSSCIGLTTTVRRCLVPKLSFLGSVGARLLRPSNDAQRISAADPRVLRWLFRRI